MWLGIVDCFYSSDKLSHSIPSPAASNLVMTCSYDSPFLPRFFNRSLVSFVITIVVSIYHTNIKPKKLLIITYNYV